MRLKRSGICKQPQCLTKTFCKLLYRLFVCLKRLEYFLVLPVFFGRRVFKQPLYLRKWQFCFYIVFLFPPLAVTLPHRFLLPVSLSARLFTEPICRRRVLINHTAIYTVRVAFPRRFECTRQPCKFIKMLIWTQIKVAINIRQFPVRTSDRSLHKLPTLFSLSFDDGRLGRDRFSSWVLLSSLPKMGRGHWNSRGENRCVRIQFECQQLLKEKTLSRLFRGIVYIIINPFPFQ